MITFSQYTSLDLLPPSPHGLEHGLQGPSTQCASQGNVLHVWLVTGFRILSQRLSLTTSRSSRDLHETSRVWYPAANGISYEGINVKILCKGLFKINKQITKSLFYCIFFIGIWKKNKLRLSNGTVFYGRSYIPPPQGALQSVKSSWTQLYSWFGGGARLIGMLYS